MYYVLSCWLWHFLASIERGGPAAALFSYIGAKKKINSKVCSPYNSD